MKLCEKTKMLDDNYLVTIGYCACHGPRTIIKPQNGQFMKLVAKAYGKKGVQGVKEFLLELCPDLDQQKAIKIAFSLAKTGEFFH